MIPVVKAKLLEGKRGLIVGIANENSIAWGCAKAFRAFGAELAVTYLNDKAKKYVEPLARELEAPILMPLDVNKPGQMEAVFERIAKDWGELDFVVHSIAFSPKDTLAGTRRRCSARRFPHHHGCVLLDVHSHGASRGAAHAQRRDALYDDLLWQPDGRGELQHHGRCQGRAGKRGALYRCRARPERHPCACHFPRTAGDARCLGIPEFDELLDKAKAKAPARSLVSIDDVGAATAFLAHDAARLITGETLYVDGGYHIID